MKDNILDTKNIVETIGDLDYESLANFLYALSEKLLLNECKQDKITEEIEEDINKSIAELIVKQKERDKKPYEFLK